MVEEKALASARRLVFEVGYDATTVDVIAGEAGVAKATIYRRWPNKARLVYDAVFGGPRTALPIADTGDIRDDLLVTLRENAQPMRDPGTNALLSRLLAEAATDAALAASLRDDLFRPRADRIAARVRTAVDRGELAPSIDAELVPALLTGPLQYLLLVHDSDLPDADLARIVDAVIGPHLPEHRSA